MIKSVTVSNFGIIDLDCTDSDSCYMELSLNIRNFSDSWKSLIEKVIEIKMIELVKKWKGEWDSDRVEITCTLEVSVPLKCKLAIAFLDLYDEDHNMEFVYIPVDLHSMGKEFEEDIKRVLVEAMLNMFA